MTSSRAPHGRWGVSWRLPVRWRRAWLLPAAPVVVVLLAAPLQAALGLPEVLSVAVVGVVEAIVPLVAAVMAVARARAASRAGGRAPGWWLLAASCGFWGVGQVAYVVYEVVLGIEAPQGSVADIGFLGFSALAPVAVLVMGLGAGRTASRVRSVLDGLIIAAALFVLSWMLLLQPILAVTDATGTALVVNLAYPVGDLVVLAVAVTVFSRTRSSQSLAAITVGAALMAVSDSLYVYLGTFGGFTTGGLLDAMWTAAFAVLASATVLPSGSDSPDGAALAGGAEHVDRTSLLVQVLPYLPFAAASAVAVVRGSREPITGSALVALVALTVLVFARQALVVLDNVQLSNELQERTAALAALAYTDTLTGLANRGAFTASLDAALRERRPVVAAFCDLDGFKAVNDACGHAVGDALLVAVARRLEGVVRGRDVVARLGGDEFAVLVRDAVGDAGSASEDLRSRLATALSVPFGLDVQQASEPQAGAASPESAGEHTAVVDEVSVSIGVVASAELGAPTAEELLHEADQRMYTAKRSRSAAR